MVQKAKVGVRVGQMTKDKRGKEYRRVEISMDDGRRASKLCYNATDPELQMQEGQEYNLVITQNGEYTNFRLARPTDLLEQEVAELKKTLEGMRIWAKKVEERLVALETFMQK